MSESYEFRIYFSDSAYAYKQEQDATDDILVALAGGDTVNQVIEHGEEIYSCAWLV